VTERQDLVIASSHALGGTAIAIPSLFAAAGEHGVRRLLEWLTAEIRNLNTRASYKRAIFRFADWCEDQGLRLEAVQPIHAAAYVEQLGRTHSKPTVKQHLAALRVLGDYLVTGQVISANPFAPVRGPKYVIKKGKTVVLVSDEMRQLLDSIDLKEDEHGNRIRKELAEFTVAELRDRALIAVMAYSFARISAVLGMDVGDYREQDKRCWLMLHEKGGKEHEVPCHHKAAEYIDAYLAVTGIKSEPKSPLFRRLDRRRRLAAGRLDRREALAMVKRRAAAAGLSRFVCNHSFRATGITVYLQNGGTIEKAAAIACHESPRTTKLYDRTQDKLSLDEVERIRFE
jgi:integrase/recombinase XerD